MVNVRFLSILTFATLLAQGQSFRPGTILVGFRPEVSNQAKLDLYALVHAGPKTRIGDLVVLEVSPGTEQASIRTLYTSGLVRYAELDIQHKASAGAAIPNDPNFGLQSDLLNTGQLFNGYRGVTGSDINVTPAWTMTTGSPSIVVALFDTGVQYTHPDLITNIWNNPAPGQPGNIASCAVGTHGYNVLTSTCDPMDDDTYWGGHGTFMAGVIGASGNNAAGIAGVNWSTNILTVKWMASNATGFTSDLVTGLNWLSQAIQAGVNVRVVSLSFTSNTYSQAFSDAIDALGAQNVLFVGSAGNMPTPVDIDITPSYPCSYLRPTVICTTALEMNDSLWVASNWGPNTVDAGVPSAGVYSTLRQSNYGILEGSSMAAAVVAGEAALLLSNSNLSTAALRSAIVNSVTPVASLATKIKSSGAVNVCLAMNGCSSAATAVPINVSSPVVTGTMGASIPTGSLVAASTGSWSGSPTKFSYQWKSCADAQGKNCQIIPHATGQTFGVFGVLFQFLQVTVTATNSVGSASATSALTAIAVNTFPPAFAINSTIADASNVSGTMTWTATPTQAVNFVEFWTDGVLLQTVSAAPYTISLDTTKLAPGTSRLGIRALLASDNRTYGYYSAVVNNTNGGLPITLIQSLGNSGSGLNSLAASFSGANTAGNMIVVFVRMSTTNQTLTVTDTLGNVYSNAVLQAQNAVSNQVGIFYAKNIRGGANTVTASFSGTNDHPFLAIYEYAGLNTTNPLDKTAAAQGASATAVTGAVVTSSASELIFAGAGFPNNWSGSVSAGGGFSIGQQDKNGTSRGVTETAIAATTGSYTGSFALSSSTNWSAVVATFSAAANNFPVIRTSSLPSGTLGAAYSFSMSASNGTPPYTWSVTAGTLPAGLSLNGSTGTISGTPTIAGAANLTIQVKDANGLTASQAFTLTANTGANAISLLQSSMSEGSGVASVTSAFPNASGAGNMIVAFVRMSTTTQTVRVADSQGNVYAKAVSQAQTADGHQTYIFFAKNIHAGANTVSATFSGANNHPFIAIYEYAGLSSSTPLDQTASAQGNTTAVSVGPTGVTASANELIFAGTGFPNAWGGTVTPGSGFALQQQDTGTSRSATETEVATAVGTFVGTVGLSQSANWSCVMATFR